MQIMKLTKRLYADEDGNIYDSLKEAKNNADIKEIHTINPRKVKVYKNEELEDSEIFTEDEFDYYIFSMKGEPLFGTNYLKEIGILTKGDKKMTTQEEFINLCIETIDILCTHSHTKLHNDRDIVDVANIKWRDYYLTFGTNRSFLCKEEYDTINQCLDEIAYYKGSKND